MKCQDCLIWIGGSYKTVDEYLREAETRGCCRQVPSWPSWAKPGETRVFLAHRDGFVGSERGVIFGYFTLHGVDIILTQQDCDKYKSLTAKCQRTPECRNDPDLLKEFWKTPEGRKHAEPLIDFWRKKLSNNRLPFRMPDGTEVPRKGLEEDVIDFLIDLLISCEPDGDADGHGGYGISADQSSLEEARDCPPGLRLGPETSNPPGRPSLYFVDTLEREIAKIFCDLLKDLLKDQLLGEEQKKSRNKKHESLAQKPKKNRSEYIAKLRAIASEEKRPGHQKGIPQFQEAVRKAARLRKSWAEVQDNLKGFATVRGAMVVFNKPYPILKKAPQAAFRGLWHIDGDKLIEQIANHTGKQALIPTIYFCKANRRHDMQPQEIVTKQDLAVWLAEELHVNKACATSLLDKISEKAREHLQQFQKFKLPGIGTIHLKTTKSGKKIVFSPHKPISSLETKVEKKD